jgi:hypothetical protein
MTQMYTLIFSLFLLGFGSSNTDRNLQVIEEQQSFDTPSFIFKYPNNWRKAGLIENLKAHIEESYTPDKFRNGSVYLSTNFAIMQKIKSAKSLKEAGDQYELSIVNSPVLSNGTLESRKKRKFAGVQALEFIGTAQMQRWQVKWKIVILHYEGSYFEISTMSEEKRYINMQTVTEPIFNSFQFK